MTSKILPLEPVQTPQLVYSTSNTEGYLSAEGGGEEENMSTAGGHDLG
jgi:hypothetical protein